MSNFFTKEELDGMNKEEIEVEERLKIPPVQMYFSGLPLPPCRIPSNELSPVCVKPAVLADSKAVLLAYLEMHGVKVRQPSCRKDGRGWLAEVWRSDDDGTLEEPSPEMAYVSVTKPGVSRGPHEHMFQTDRFVFLTGSWRVKLWDNRKVSSTKNRVMVLELSKPTVVIVPPGVVHAYVNVSMKPAMVLNLPDKLYRGVGKLEEVDEIRHEENKKYSLSDVIPWWSRFVP